MAKNSNIIFRKTEIICIFKVKEGIGKTTKKAALTYSNIHSISMKPCRERKGLKVVDSERIIIRSNKLLKPIEYYKFKEKNFFEDYKAGLRIFCKQNRITLYDEVE